MPVLQPKVPLASFSLSAREKALPFFPLDGPYGNTPTPASVPKKITNHKDAWPLNGSAAPCLCRPGGSAHFIRALRDGFMLNCQTSADPRQARGLAPSSSLEIQTVIPLFPHRARPGPSGRVVLSFCTLTTSHVFLFPLPGIRLDTVDPLPPCDLRLLGFICSFWHGKIFAQPPSCFRLIAPSFG